MSVNGPHQICSALITRFMARLSIAMGYQLPHRKMVMDYTGYILQQQDTTAFFCYINISLNNM